MGGPRIKCSVEDTWGGWGPSEPVGTLRKPGYTALSVRLFRTSPTIQSIMHMRIKEEGKGGTVQN